MSDKLYTNRIYETIQGEGSFTGTPITLLRLQGCDVLCKFCDTKETWAIGSGGSVLAYETILGQCKSKYILITGGEPLLQAVSLAGFIKAAQAIGHLCHIETSGTIYNEPVFNTADWITVSPKWDNPARRPIIQDAMNHANEIKLLVSEDDTENTVLSAITKIGKCKAIISLQPVSGNKKATKLCTAMAMKLGHNLSIQVHKLIQIE